MENLRKLSNTLFRLKVIEILWNANRSWKPNSSKNVKIFQKIWGIFEEHMRAKTIKSQCKNV